jgi:Nif-specific regulatory protein/two-component system response regulator HydG
MDVNGELVQIAKKLLSEEDEDKTAEILLRRVLEATGAERGFIVLREGQSFEQKSHIRFDREQLSRQERDFSRSLVRKALETQQIIYSPNVPDDPRFAALDSVVGLGACCVLVAPLRHGEEVYGVVYLEHRSLLNSFGAESRRFLAEFCELAGLVLRRALERQALRERNRELERDLFSQYDFAGIVTQDAKMLELLQTVAQVADSDATVLILGETGTGKELIARALHANSRRRTRPFVPVHCTALPSTLLESELFGHVRGAFTGAERDRAGRIAIAAGGTLFLDEIAEIPLELQAKLLRFLQFGEVQRLGSDRTERSDVRVLAATHRELPALIEAGKFRQDLYFRLNVLELAIPPLRERRGDILRLVEHFLRKHWKRPGQTPRFSTRALRPLETYAYPGNVRELEHLVERACLLARAPELDLELLPPALTAQEPQGPVEFERFTNEELKTARESAVAGVERRFLEGLLRRCEGNISRAAREADLPRSYLQRLLARHGMGPGSRSPRRLV